MLTFAKNQNPERTRAHGLAPKTLPAKLVALGLILLPIPMGTCKHICCKTYVSSRNQVDIPSRNPTATGACNNNPRPEKRISGKKKIKMKIEGPLCSMMLYQRTSDIATLGQQTTPSDPLHKFPCCSHERYEKGHMFTAILSKLSPILSVSTSLPVMFP